MFQQADSVSMLENLVTNSDAATLAQMIKTMTEALNAKKAATHSKNVAASKIIHNDEGAKSKQHNKTTAFSNCYEITFENERIEIDDSRDDELNSAHENHQGNESDVNNDDGFHENIVDSACGSTASADMKIMRMSLEAMMTGKILNAAILDPTGFH